MWELEPVLVLILALGRGGSSAEFMQRREAKEEWVLWWVLGTHVFHRTLRQGRAPEHHPRRRPALEALGHLEVLGLVPVESGAGELHVVVEAPVGVPARA
jgi:hypothetical protein